MASANLVPCLAIVLVYEGGKVDDPRDPGGRTNEGVTQRVYDAYRTKAGLALQSVYAMAPVERDAIYRTGYWTKIGADALPLGVDLASFDPAVNSGPARALEWLRAAQAAGGGDTAVITGISSSRLSFLHAIGNWSAFGKGWGARVADVEAKAHRMALGMGPSASAAIQAKAAVHHAKARTASTRARSAGPAAVVTSGSVAVSGGHTGLVLALMGIAAVAAAILAFTAFRHSQRATALSTKATK